MPRRVPDDWTVWAFTDIHAIVDGLTKALSEAGLATADGHWKAPAKTALIGVGDYIDRGPDSAPVVDLLRRLSLEASAAGGRVVLVRGNHEHMLSDVLRGDREWQASWLANGGRALLSSYGLGEASVDRRVPAALRARAPDLLPWPS